MLASVSPESYRAIINGQSDWGIFPLLLDFSIIKDLGAKVSSLSHVGCRPIVQDIYSVRTRTKCSESHKKIMERAVQPGVLPKRRRERHCQPPPSKRE
jgi:hypothetical protein